MGGLTGKAGHCEPEYVRQFEPYIVTDCLYCLIALTEVKPIQTIEKHLTPS